MDEAPPSLWRSRTFQASVLMAVLILVVMSLSASRMVDASKQLDQAQGDFLISRVAETMRAGDLKITQEDVELALAQNLSLGLHGITLALHSGTLIAKSETLPNEGLQTLSKSLPPPTRGQRRRNRNQRDPLDPPPRRPSTGPPPSGQPGPPPGNRPPDWSPPRITILFVNHAADTARTQALIQMVLAIVSGLAMMLLGARFAKAEQKKERLQHELSGQKLLASLGEMSAVLAHELRNPLGALKGHAQLLVEEIEDLQNPDFSTERATRLVNESTRLESILNNLLTFVRSGELELEPTRIVDLVKKASSPERYPHAEHHFDISDDDHLVPLDAGRFALAVENLLRNAEAAGSGRIWVGLHEYKKHMSLRIEDDGQGVAPDVADRIFEPFFTNKTKGTGLGLALSSRIVGAHGGTLKLVTAEHLGGAAFEITLPLAQT